MQHLAEALSLKTFDSKNISLERCVNVHLAEDCCRPRKGVILADFELMNCIINDGEFVRYMMYKTESAGGSITIVFPATTLQSEETGQKVLLYMTYTLGSRKAEVGIIPADEPCELKNVFRIVHRNRIAA